MEKLAHKRSAFKVPCSPPKSRLFPLASAGACPDSVRSSTAPSQRPPAAQAGTGGSGLQQTVKADLVIVSKSHFKVVAPYDTQLVGIFKRMPSRMYGGWRVVGMACRGEWAGLCWVWSLWR